MRRRAREVRALREMQRNVWGDGYFRRYSQAAKRRARKIDAGVGIMLVGLVVTTVGMLADHAPATPEPPAHKVTLCHATDSRTNPYRRITVDVASLWFEGHNDHDGPVFSQSVAQHEKWGDVIPPFHYPGGYYDGMNWDRAGRNVFDDGCGVPTPKCGASDWCPQKSTTSSSSTSSTSTSSTTSTTCPKTSTSSSTSTTSTSVTITTVGSTVTTSTTTMPPTSTTGATVPPTQEKLPSTGADSGTLVAVGLSTFGGGLALSLRRRKARG